MTNVGINGFPTGASGVVQDGSVTAAKLAAPGLIGYMRSGYYYFTAGSSSTSTASLPQGSLRLLPWFVPNGCTLTKIGAEVTTIGDVGSLFRLGIYADTGAGFPGKLILDAGTIAGDSGTVQEITINQALPAGVYWVGGASQSVSVTAPTLRTPSGMVLSGANLLVQSTIPTAGQTLFGHGMSSVTGALPAVFSLSPGAVGNVARVFVKVA